MQGARSMSAKVRAEGRSASSMIVEEDRRLIFRLSILSRLLVFILVHASAHSLPLFDASPDILNLNPLWRPLFRWDVFHFFHIAHHSYLYEHQWAFFPALPLIIRYSPCLIVVLACDASQTLYSLSLYHLPSHNHALLATLLSLLPASPVTAYFAPYTEPFFTYLSYRGMLCCTRQQWFFASLLFALAAMFRSNGIFLAGFLIWGLLVRPFMDRQKPQVIKSLALTAIVLSPFIGYQYLAYLSFCSHSPQPQWCSKTLPLIYPYVQSKYWNVGFLRYWTINQLPNFLLAAPTLLLIYTYCIYHLQKMLPQLRFSKSSTPSRSFKLLAIDPHAIYATILCLLFLVASHTQIVLRLAGSIPLTYWAAAWLVSEHHSLGRLWVTWSVLWSVISIVLWSAFLPPA
ncbi:mannosyltransferase [Phlegmacium glaucopus]|nr:mannosyltransferase [Phlegmacium glaucopus]